MLGFREWLDLKKTQIDCILDVLFIIYIYNHFIWGFFSDFFVGVLKMTYFMPYVVTLNYFFSERTTVLFGAFSWWDKRSDRKKDKVKNMTKPITLREMQ